MRRRRLAVWLLEKLFVTEIIGQPECPLMRRWTLLATPLGKVMIHHFPPGVSDRDPHDHPSPFFTLILKGGYFNIEWTQVDLGDQEQVPEIEWMGRGRLAFRPAKHTHITETGPNLGAWTIVLMGPKTRRNWGFLRVEDGSWWPWKRYVERYGGVVRCDTGELDDSVPGTYAPYKGTTPPLAGYGGSD